MLKFNSYLITLKSNVCTVKVKLKHTAEDTHYEFLLVPDQAQEGSLALTFEVCWT